MSDTPKLKLFQTPSSVWSTSRPLPEQEYSSSSQVMLPACWQESWSLPAPAILDVSALNDSPPSWPQGSIPASLVTIGKPILLEPYSRTVQTVLSEGPTVRYYAKQNGKHLARYARMKPKGRIQEPLVDPAIYLVTIPDLATPTSAPYLNMQQFVRAFRKSVRSAADQLALPDYKFYAFYGKAIELFVDPETLEVAAQLDGKRHRVQIDSVEDMTSMQDGAIPRSERQAIKETEDADLWSGDGFTL